MDPSFVFTVLFMLLGPVKLIPAFAEATREYDEQFVRAVAIRATLIASLVAALVAVAGTFLLGRYHITIDGLRLGGGLVLLIAALNTIFPRAQPPVAAAVKRTVLQLAVSPLTTPIIMPPAGVAAILIFMMLAPENPGMWRTVAISLAIVMGMDFLAMYYNRRIVKAPGLMLVLQVLGAVLIFMQVALAVETILSGVRDVWGL